VIIYAYPLLQGS